MKPPKTLGKTWILTLFWIQCLAMVLFLKGFLPIKDPDPGLASVEDVPEAVRR